MLKVITDYSFHTSWFKFKKSSFTEESYMSLKQHECWHQFWVNYPFNFIMVVRRNIVLKEIYFNLIIWFSFKTTLAKQSNGTGKAAIAFSFSLLLFFFSWVLCHCVLFTVSLLAVIHLSLLRFPAGWWPVSVKGSLGTPSAPSSQETEGLSALYISRSHQVISGCKCNT